MCKQISSMLCRRLKNISTTMTFFKFLYPYNIIISLLCFFDVYIV